MNSDVAIVGYGPVGATLAGLLGREGLRVVVFDKAAHIYGQPRAVGFDHDAMRLFQRIGVAEALAPHISDFRDSCYLGAAGQIIRRVERLRPPYPLTWQPNYTCDQPGVEGVLRQAVARMPTVRVALQQEVVALRDEGAQVAFGVRAPGGEVRQHTARYLVGCDGASSSVRSAAGLALESLSYDEPWIVVDLKVDPAFLHQLPQTNIQYCEPERPCTYIVCPGNHRRWEFMMLNGEPREGAVSPERLWKLLARWLTPEQATLWRAAAYRFHALIARDWQRGRLLLAGDSAHQTPPFLGQGMCQGLRDAGNLAWKLAWVLRGKTDASLLDTYTQERRPHVVATTHLAKDIGQMLSERDPAKAAARDVRLLAAGGGQPQTLIRQELIPPLSAGLLAKSAPLAGNVFPQPVVQRGAAPPCLLDDLLPPGFYLVIDARFDAPAWDALADLHGVHLIVLDVADSDTPNRLGALHERDGLVRRWLECAGLCGALVRPDHYVFGGFTDLQAAAQLLDSAPLRAVLAAPHAQALHSA